MKSDFLELFETKKYIRKGINRLIRLYLSGLKEANCPVVRNKRVICLEALIVNMGIWFEIQFEDICRT